MIRASELRIGNFIESENFMGLKDIETVTAISERGINEAGEFITEFEYINPIPLTEEWLLKFGLIERYCNGEWSWANCKKENQGKWDSYTEIRKREIGFSYLPDYRLIKYVHQLQNLYFALTGEELTINP